MFKPLLLKQILGAIGTTLLIGNVVSASATPETISENTKPLLLAELRNFCSQGESVFVLAETKGFWVNICGGDLPHHYVGVSKVDGKRIRLPLANYDQQGNYFEAVNGNVSYLLIRGTAKGDFLTVTQGDRELVRQPILRWE